jgi:2-methylcitrate dehydratase PrpD
MTPIDSTSVVVQRAAELQLRDLPAVVLDQAKVVLADTVAIILAASLEHSVQVASAALPLTTCGVATVIGHGRGAAPEQAAFINAVGGHQIELDDSHSPSRTHAACVLVPAVLAAAEAAGGSTGADILVGIVAGYDAQVRLSKAIGVQRQFDHGFHPSSVCGTVGAAIASGRVLSLSAEQMRASLTLAASQSSGLMSWQDDSTHMVKSFQTGIAARNGLYASQLAKSGYQGVRDVLTGRHSMLVTFGGPGPSEAELTADLGQRWDICETSIKRYPCGGQTHAAIAAVLALREVHDLKWQDIEKIDVQLAHDAISIIDNNPLLIANIQYVLALAAHEGHILREHFTDPSWPANPEIAALKQKVDLRGSAVIDAGFPAKKGAIVAITTSAGEFTESFDAPPGSPSHPLSPAELRGKFLDLATDVLSDDAAARLWELLERFETVESTAEFFEIIAGQAPWRRVETVPS